MLQDHFITIKLYSPAYFPSEGGSDLVATKAMAAVKNKIFLLLLDFHHFEKVSLDLLLTGYKTNWISCVYLTGSRTINQVWFIMEALFCTLFGSKFWMTLFYFANDIYIQKWLYAL